MFRRAPAQPRKAGGGPDPEGQRALPRGREGAARPDRRRLARRTSLIVLDTHAWLWHVAAPERLSAAARAVIASSVSIGVCTISCWEVAMLERRGRIALDRDLRDWVGQAFGLERAETIPLTPEIAVDAALVAEDFPGDPADRIIYATAVRLDARLVTKDAALRRFDRERTVW